jgi:acetyl-CoA acetyltransferase
MREPEGLAAIAGLGMTDLGKVFGRSPRRLAADAVRLAVADAGLALADVDGLLVSHGMSGSPGIELAAALGLHDLRLLTQMSALGATAGAMISYAAMSVLSGAASTVACVFADAPLRRERPAGAAYHRDAPEYHGFRGMTAALGFRSVNAFYALAAQRHMARYGTTSEQLGAIAVATRRWAARNPRAQLRDPITIDDHQRSRWVVEPLHLLDCCLVSNGAIAVVVTGAGRALDLVRPPVYIWGWGQGHPGHRGERAERGGSGGHGGRGERGEWGLTTGAVTSGQIAMKMAGVTTEDVSICQLYDCYTYTVLVSLEDYGFCAKGEGGAFAASGALGPGGALPTNTGGGQLSAYYMWGMTPLSEAVIQARGDGGERQVETNDVILVSGNGGILDHHSTVILSPHPRG